MGWGLLDRRLSRATRHPAALLAARLPRALGRDRGLVAPDRHGLRGEARLSGSGLYVSYSRYKIWWNSLALMAQHPWLGVGFGEFNFVWTLTPFPDRPVAFFDHAHNLMLQFGVELGIPLTLLVLGLMGYRALAGDEERRRRRPRARCALQHAVGQPAGRCAGLAHRRLPMQRAAVVMVVMAATHSLLEYPLWYSYFLPARGVRLRPLSWNDPIRATGRSPPPSAARHAAAGAGADAADPRDHARALGLHAGGRSSSRRRQDAAPLDKRIADGRKSILFAHHADYAAATVVEHPAR
jgi:hypothetical protein